MKKIILAISLVVVVALGATACSEKKDDESSMKLVKSGTLTVCSDVPYAPFLIQDGDKINGIDADIMRAIAEQIDLDAEFVDTDFDAIFAALSSGNCDVIASSVSITEERKKSNNFSDSYFDIKQSLLVTKDNEETLTDLDKFDGKVIGVQSETTGEAFAQENAEANGYTVKSFTGADELVSALRAGQIDAVLQDYPINAYEAKTSGTSVVTKQFDGDESYGIVIPKGSTELLEKINDALAELKESGKYDDILAAYFG